MRRKQLYAIILAGALAASSAPAAVFAAEGDVAATAETSEENPVDGETAAATEAPASASWLLYLRASVHAFLSDGLQEPAAIHL